MSRGIRAIDSKSLVWHTLSSNRRLHSISKTYSRSGCPDVSLVHPLTKASGSSSLELHIEHSLIVHFLSRQPSSGMHYLNQSDLSATMQFSKSHSRHFILIKLLAFSVSFNLSVLIFIRIHAMYFLCTAPLLTLFCGNERYINYMYVCMYVYVRCLHRVEQFDVVSGDTFV